MTRTPETPAALELLAPARNADIGIAAIDHGADAVYIGGPAFGARGSAGNAVDDVARLARHAHRYFARVYVALNTILRDDELASARDMAWAVYGAGADALIVQDMGLLELDLPPIALHASTQMDNRDAAKVSFLQQVGFSQVVLARELTLDDIAAIAKKTDACLEFFIHGALCVSYSGQCNISHALTGRSANRGECAQICRLPMTLSDGGTVLSQNKHLLSLKDNDQSANIADLAAAGIRSFKIEGRLKDMAYVKNITAHYRQILDTLIDADPRYCRASSGRCEFTFTPDPKKTFNRGGTDYFVNGRSADISAFDTPKFSGEAIGRVVATEEASFVIEASVRLNNGDGLAFFDAAGELTGLRVNRVEALLGSKAQQRILLARDSETPALGSKIFRNRDQQFERALEKPTASRCIAVSGYLSDIAEGLRLTLVDADGVSANAELKGSFEAAQNDDASECLQARLGKLGNTIFHATEVRIETRATPHLSPALANALRRDAVLALEGRREEAYTRPERHRPVTPAPTYPQGELSYLGNVLNSQARAFYQRHGVDLIANAYECNQEAGEVSLMITRHCLRYSFALCPKEVPGIRPDPLTLVSGNSRFTLRFDCKRCEMHVVGKLRQAGERPTIPISFRALDEH